MFFSVLWVQALFLAFGFLSVVFMLIGHSFVFRDRTSHFF